MNWRLILQPIVNINSICQIGIIFMRLINCSNEVRQKYSQYTHNTHEIISRVQEGCTSLLLFGALTEQLTHDEPGKDETGLGRWSVMTLMGDGVRTRVVCRYNPCYNKNPDSSMSHQ
jgi:hypothetical protein